MAERISGRAAPGTQQTRGIADQTAVVPARPADVGTALGGIHRWLTERSTLGMTVAGLDPTTIRGALEKLAGRLDVQLPPTGPAPATDPPRTLKEEVVFLCAWLSDRQGDLLPPVKDLGGTWRVRTKDDRDSFGVSNQNANLVVHMNGGDGAVVLPPELRAEVDFAFNRAAGLAIAEALLANPEAKLQAPKQHDGETRIPLENTQTFVGLRPNDAGLEVSIPRASPDANFRFMLPRADAEAFLGDVSKKLGGPLPQISLGPDVPVSAAASNRALGRSLIRLLLADPGLKLRADGNTTLTLVGGELAAVYAAKPEVWDGRPYKTAPNMSPREKPVVSHRVQGDELAISIPRTPEPDLHFTLPRAEGEQFRRELASRTVPPNPPGGPE